MLSECGSVAVPELIGLLKNKDAPRADAAWALGRIGDIETVRPLLEAAQDDSGDVGAAATEALVRFPWRGGRVYDQLVVALKDKEPGVRSVAVRVLGKRCGPTAMKPLVTALKDRNPEIRQAAAEALKKIRGREEK